MLEDREERCRNNSWQVPDLNKISGAHFQGLAAFRPEKLQEMNRKNRR